MKDFKTWLETNKRQIAWSVVMIAIMMAGFLGVVYPMPEPPTPTAPPVQPTGSLYGRFEQNLAVNTLTVRNTQMSLPTSTPMPTATPQISNTLYVVCSSSTITGTGTIAHGLATPSYITYGLAQDATGDGARLSHTNVTATVTIKVWNSALTPAAATTPVTVDWCAAGTK